VISHGTPTRTNLFTVERLVQETPGTLVRPGGLMCFTLLGVLTR